VFGRGPGIRDELIILSERHFKMILSPNDNIPNEKVAKMQLCKLLLSQIKTFSNEVFTSGNIF